MQVWKIYKENGWGGENWRWDQGGDGGVHSGGGGWEGEGHGG